VVFETQAMCDGLKKPHAGYNKMLCENPDYVVGPRHYQYN